MNSDGQNDIVVRSGRTEITVIKQTTPGAFSATPDRYVVPTTIIGQFVGFQSFALGDLNGDGRTDISLADDLDSGPLNIFLQNTNGILDVTYLPQVLTGKEVDIADLNGDGLNDIVSFWPGASAFQIYYQAADHSFMTPLIMSTGISGSPSVIEAITIGDVHNDTVPDIVASWSNYGIYVLPRKP